MTKQKGSMRCRTNISRIKWVSTIKIGAILGMEKKLYNSTMPLIIGMSLFELRLGKEAKKQIWI
jgi:hypothetical protein